MMRYVAMIALFPFVLANSLTAIEMPQRRLFEAEQRFGDPRPKLDPTPKTYPSPKRGGAGEGSTKGGWVTNGITVFDTGGAALPQICTDGNYGAIVCWLEKFRSGPGDTDYDIYAQRVDSGGNEKWVHNGVPICSLSVYNSRYQAMVSDGQGGAIIAWEDNRLGSTRVYAQRVDSLGNGLWAVNGVQVCSQFSGYVDLCSDGHGGAIIAYMDGRDEVNTSDNIYTQRIDSAGNPAWTIDGVPVCTADSIQANPHICSNNRGGAIVTWEDDYRNNGTTGEDVYAQMLDSLGNDKWTVNGDTICIKPGIQRGRNPIANNVGGGLIGWWELADSGGTYTQSLDSTGSKQWSNDVRLKYGYFLESDSHGEGVWASTVDANRIDEFGNIKWGTGVNLFNDTTGMNGAAYSDGNGGILVIRDDRRNNPNYSDQYAQKADSSGNVMWADSGVMVCNLEWVDETYPKITNDGLGGAICTWGESFIFVQRVYYDGHVGGVAGEPTTSIQYSVFRIKCYPNPFRVSANIRYSINKAQRVSVNIYNINGQLVRTLVDGQSPSGIHSIRWDGRDSYMNAVASGIYCVRVQTGEKTIIQKILKLK